MIPQSYFQKVKKHFNCEKKAWRWFASRNPNFLMQSPMQFLKAGKTHKVTSYIDKEMNDATEKR